jgi:hypothetical protein
MNSGPVLAELDELCSRGSIALIIGYRCVALTGFSMGLKSLIHPEAKPSYPRLEFQNGIIAINRHHSTSYHRPSLKANPIHPTLQEPHLPRLQMVFKLLEIQQPTSAPVTDLALHRHQARQKRHVQWTVLVAASLSAQPPVQLCALCVKLGGGRSVDVERASGAVEVEHRERVGRGRGWDRVGVRSGEGGAGVG